VKPVCQRSATCSRCPVSGSSANRGRPRRVSSIPSTRTGAGSAGSIAVAHSAKAADTTGQDKPMSRPTALTVRPPTATAAPAAAFNRAVTRAPGPSCGIDSVNEDRTHPDVRQRHRRLCHTSRAGTGSATSRGLVLTHPFTDVAGVRHDGHTAAASSWASFARGAVDTCTTRHPSGSSSTRSTTTPSSPNNNVVSSCTPALFLIDCLSNSHDHEGRRAPHIGGSIHPRTTTGRHRSAGSNDRCPAKIEDPVFTDATS
jgi:hypothetical protein